MKFDLSTLDLRAILAKPSVKTATAAVVGVAATTIDNALSNPTGGALNYAHSHPLTFWLASMFAHNLISKFAPPPTVALASPGGSQP